MLSLQGRRPSSQCLRWRRRGRMATLSPRRTAPPAGRSPECGSPPRCATPAWRSLPLKCSKSANHWYIWYQTIHCNYTILIALLLLIQISGPPFSPQPPGSGGIPGVCASRLLQGGTADTRPQRAPGPSLQQLGDRVDHERAGRHDPLRTAHPGRVKGATREAFGWKWGESARRPSYFNKLTTKSNPCLERETPLESSCSYCGLLSISFVYFWLFALGLF